MQWRFAPFAELTPQEVHDLFQARAAAFVVEQSCVFQDIDGVDPQCWHLLGYLPSPQPSPKGEGAKSPSPLGEGRGEGKQLVAYCRLLPPGTKFAEPSIGRVVTTSAVRGTGHGRALMCEALARAERLWPGRAIRIAAQQHLQKFYAEYGFATVSEPYDDDGVPHVEMVRAAAAVAAPVS